MATLPKEIAEPCAAIGRRSAPRARVQLNASLETTTETSPVVLRNLSCTGAMVEGNRLPPLNRVAILRRGSIDAMAIVVWREGDRCGLRFFDPIAHDQVVTEARCPPERPRGQEIRHWTTASNVVTADGWRQVQQAYRAEGRALRGFS